MLRRLDIYKYYTYIIISYPCRTILSMPSQCFARPGEMCDPFPFAVWPGREKCQRRNIETWRSHGWNLLKHLNILKYLLICWRNRLEEVGMAESWNNELSADFEIRGVLLVLPCLTRGLFGGGGASQLGPGQFASLGAGSFGFCSILLTWIHSAGRYCTLRLGLQVVIIPFVPASNLFFKAWLGISVKFSLISERQKFHHFHTC